MQMHGCMCTCDYIYADSHGVFSNIALQGICLQAETKETSTNQPKDVLNRFYHFFHNQATSIIKLSYAPGNKMLALIGLYKTEFISSIGSSTINFLKFTLLLSIIFTQGVSSDLKIRQ